MVPTKRIIITLIVFGLLSIETIAQFMVSGENLYSTATFIAQGKDSSSLVLGKFLTYEIEQENISNITAYNFELGDSIVTADSCGYEHSTYQIFLASISSGGVVDWINISSGCDTLSEIDLIGLETDDQGNAIVLGNYDNQVEISGDTLISEAVKDIFIYKFDPEGNFLWSKSGFSLGDTSSVIASDLLIRPDGIYLSGNYRGAASFTDSTFLAVNEQFFLLKMNDQGNDLEVKAASGISSSSTSDMHYIDIQSTGEITGVISLYDSILVLSHKTGITGDTIYSTGGFHVDTLYVIDSLDLNKVTVRADSFNIEIPPDSSRWFYLAEKTAILDESIILDTLTREDPATPETKIHLAIFRGDTLALSHEIPAVPDDFLIDPANNGMYGLYNYSTDLKFYNALIPSYSYPSSALVKYDFLLGHAWNIQGHSATDTIRAMSFCVDPSSNIYISGSVGSANGNHVLTFGDSAFNASTDGDGFVVKTHAEEVLWGQIIGDSATDFISDLYAIDRFNIVAAGEYSERIDYGQFSISTSGVRDMFAFSVLPYPEFDLNVESTLDETIPLCEGDSVKLTASSGHDCTFQWMKDSMVIDGMVADTLWVKESGNYYLSATSNEIFYDNLDPYVRNSKSFSLQFNPYPNDSVIVRDSTSFCAGDYALLNIELLNSDSCSWYELNTGLIDSLNHIKVEQDGAYFARIEGESGCVSWTDTIEISTIALPFDSIAIAEENNLFCSGDSLELQTFDPGTNDIVWYMDGDSLLTTQTPNIYFQTTGAYFAKITDKDGCSSITDTLNLVKIIPPALQSWFEDETDGICVGERSEIRISSHDKTVYNWFYNNDTIQGYDSPVYYAEESGDYRVTAVKEGVCFVNSDIFSLVVHPLPTPVINVLPDSVICDNETAQITVNSGANDLYQWYRNDLPMDDSTSNSISVSLKGSYSVEAINQFNCSATTRKIPILIKVSPSATIASGANKTNYCKNDSLLLYIENAKQFIYQWQRDGNNIADTSKVRYAKIPGSYMVHINDTATGCYGFTNSLEIDEVELPDNTVQYQAINPLCERDTVVLNATEDATNYEWRINGSVQILNSSHTLSATKDGTYQVKLTNESNCVSVSEPVTLTFLESQVPPIQQDLNFVSTLQYDNIQWYRDNEPIPAASGQVYLVYQSGFYHLEVTHANGCRAASRDIQVCIPLPEVEVDHNVLTASEGEQYQWFFGSDTIFGATDQVYIAQLTGSYSVDITLSDQCTSRSDEVEVCYPVPTIEVQPNNVLKASLGLSYQWYRNDVPIEEADARLYVVVESGSYKVEIESLENCLSSSDPVYMDLTGVNNAFGGFIKISPNPFDDQFRIELTSTNDFSGSQIQLVNTLGNAVLQQNISANPTTIHTRSLAPGVYFAIISHEGKVFHVKLLKN